LTDGGVLIDPRGLSYASRSAPAEDGQEVSDFISQSAT
jgi:hypothetical protein